MTCLMADAFAAFARDDIDEATERLSRATELATSRIELRDIVEGMLLRLPLLSDDGVVAVAHERAVQALGAGPVREREQWLARNPPSPERELAAALATHVDQATTLGPIQTALLAVRARRDAHAGRREAAVAAYQALLGSSFEPEATLGLTRALREMAEEQAAVGDVDHVRRLMERMTALEYTEPAEAATAVASALERNHRCHDAREQLEAAIAMATDDRERAKLHQRAGGLALAQDDLDRASAHLHAALEIAHEREAHGRSGQLQIRMALIAILRDDVTAAGAHLLAAARAWKEGGAVDPTAALNGELHGLERARGANVERAAREALRLVELAAGAEVVDEDLALAVNPLQRELDG